MWWAVWTVGILAVGGGMLWWGWRRADEIVAVPVCAPRAGMAPVLADVFAVKHPPVTEAELANGLLAGRLPAERYRAEMTRLADGDAHRPVPIPE